MNSRYAASFLGDFPILPAQNHPHALPPKRNMAWNRSSIRWTPSGTLARPLSRVRPRGDGRPCPSTMMMPPIPAATSTADGPFDQAAGSTGCGFGIRLATKPRACRHADSNASASANRKHDVPSATSDFPSPTSNPNDGDGCACDDADGPPPLESPPLFQARCSS